MSSERSPFQAPRISFPEVINSLNREVTRLKLLKDKHQFMTFSPAIPFFEPILDSAVGYIEATITVLNRLFSVAREGQSGSPETAIESEHRTRESTVESEETVEDTVDKESTEEESVDERSVEQKTRVTRKGNYVWMLAH